MQSCTTATSRSSWPYLQYVLRGIKRSAGSSNAARSRLPITPDILCRLRSVWVPNNSFSNLLLWTTACLAFFGFMRMGEVTSMPGSPPSITADGVAVDSHSSPSTIRLTLHHAKTDPFGSGTAIFLGKTGHPYLCPVQALLAYLSRRPGPRSGPLLIHEGGQPLTRDQFVRLLKDALSACGIDCKGYSGHSFRIGAATAAAQAGIPDHLIKTLGRWESEAYQTYIRTPPSILAAVSLALARDPPRL